MCGLVPGEEDELPPLWERLAERHATKSDKRSTVRRYIGTRAYWKEAKVRPLATLVNMIVRRDFEEELSRSSLISAAKGLTPFAVPAMSEQAVDNFNEQSQVLEYATATTVRDITASKIVAEAPQSFTSLVRICEVKVTRSK